MLYKQLRFRRIESYRCHFLGYIPAVSRMLTCPLQRFIVKRVKSKWLTSIFSQSSNKAIALSQKATTLSAVKFGISAGPHPWKLIWVPGSMMFPSDGQNSSGWGFIAFGCKICALSFTGGCIRAQSASHTTADLRAYIPLQIISEQEDPTLPGARRYQSCEGPWASASTRIRGVVRLVRLVSRRWWKTPGETFDVNWRCSNTGFNESPISRISLFYPYVMVNFRSPCIILMYSCCYRNPP